MDTAKFEIGDIIYSGSREVVHNIFKIEEVKRGYNNCIYYHGLNSYGHKRSSPQRHARRAGVSEINLYKGEPHEE